MGLRHRNKHSEEGDVEKEKERQQAEENKSELLPLSTDTTNRRTKSLRRTDRAEYEGDEYEVLLRFVSEQAEKIKRKGGDDDEEEEEAKYTRKWYMPWKKVRVENTNKKVCSASQSLETKRGKELIQIDTAGLARDRSNERFEFRGH